MKSQLVITLLSFSLIGLSQSRPSPVVSAEPAVRTRVQAPSTIAIPAGTRIRVRLAQTLDTKHARNGGAFEATLDDPIVHNNRVIVPRGTPFYGTVIESKSSGRFRGRAVLEVNLRSFRLHGVTYRIATAPDTRVSGSHRNRNLAFMAGGPAAGAGVGAIAGGGPGAAIGAGVGAAAGATTAFITGRKNVKLPVETQMTFALRSPIHVPRA